MKRDRRRGIEDPHAIVTDSDSELGKRHRTRVVVERRRRGPRV